ncbi:MAG: hypothetical protein KAU58_04055, partial [Candidatus Omnitrophica bacterium]|nr:hypothetical protein [Candidatus Omnitrophota bacterium]
MHKHFLDNRLMSEIPEEVWQRDWSKFEKKRYAWFTKHHIGNIYLIVAFATLLGIVYSLFKKIVFPLLKPKRRYVKEYVLEAIKRGKAEVLQGKHHGVATQASREEKKILEKAIKQTGTIHLPQSLGAINFYHELSKMNIILIKRIEDKPLPVLRACLDIEKNAIYLLSESDTIEDMPQTPTDFLKQRIIRLKCLQRIERRKKEIFREKIKHSIYYGITLWLTFFATGCILATFNYSFFYPLSIFAFGITFLPLGYVIVEKYPIAFITRHVVEPLYRLCTGKSMLFPHRLENYRRIRDDDLTNIFIPIRVKDAGELTVNFKLAVRNAIRILKEGGKNNDENFFYVLWTQLIPEGERAGELKDKFYNFVNILEKIANEGPTEALLNSIPDADERYRSEFDEEIIELLRGMKSEDIVKIINRLYIINTEKAPLVKPFNHHLYQRWLMESDDEYRIVDPRFNVYPDPDDPKKTLPIGGIILGDKEYLKGIRKENRREGINKVKITQVYDNPNTVKSYEDLLKIVSVVADDRNKHILYQAVMEFDFEDVSLFSKVMQVYPNAMLFYTQEATQMIEGGVRAFGKYTYRSNDYYRIVIKPYGYERIFPLGSKKLLQSEDEIVGILTEIAGFHEARLIPDAFILEDPAFTYAQLEDREYSKWLPVFDLMNMLILRVLPIIRNFPVLLPTICSLGVIGLALLALVSVKTLLVLTVPLLVFNVIFAIHLRKLSKIIKERADVPDLPPSSRYQSNQCIRGAFSETIWAIQLTTTILARFFPGTIETLFPFFAEINFLTIMALLVHPKFTTALIALKKSTLRKAPVTFIATFLKGNLEWVSSTSVYITKIVTKPFVLIKELVLRSTVVLYALLGKPLPHFLKEMMVWKAALAKAENLPLIQWIWRGKTPFTIGL